MNGREEVMRMDCRQFKELVHDLDRPGTPGLALREVALAHAESCGSCARLLTDSEALDFSLQTIAAHSEDAHISPRVEAALLREMRNQKAATSRRRVQWRLAALGVAATVLLTLGVSLRHMSMSRQDAVTADPSASANGSGAGANGSSVVSDNVGSDWQDATAFVSLPYAADPATLEGGTVVRVELSRFALVSMGMPVADAGATDRIPADIMLSEDGAPQAIRLVSQVGLGQ